jgi:hypothetical protein
MTSVWNEPLQHQFAAAIDMLERAIRACPPAEWDDASLPVARRFSYIAFHTAFWLDMYLAETDAGFQPPAPFTLDEMDPAGIYPATAYTPEQVLRYLVHGRAKAGRVLAGLTDARAGARCGISFRDMSVLELHLYNLRHVQHHAGQLNLLLRQRIDDAPRWVASGELGERV